MGTGTSSASDAKAKASKAISAGTFKVTRKENHVAMTSEMKVKGVGSVLVRQLPQTVGGGFLYRIDVTDKNGYTYPPLMTAEPDMEAAQKRARAMMKRDLKL